MNDIEILEEFIKYFETEAISRKYRRNISITVGEDDIEAIENLIKENKELEKYKKYYKTEKVVWSRKDYISKDKIKELKEKIHKVLDENGITRAYQILIDEEFEELL